jgi:hypothetical protein
MEAVKATLDILGGIEPPKAPAMASEVGTAQNTAPANQPQPKKTIPNLGSGKAASPGKPKYKSLDDLKKAHAAMMAQ